MSVPTIFDLFAPRPDVLAGTSSDSDFAADLSQVIRRSGGLAQYKVPARSFAGTPPKRGHEGLLVNGCAGFRARSGAVSDQLIPFMASLVYEAA